MDGTRFFGGILASVFAIMVLTVLRGTMTRALMRGGIWGTRRSEADAVRRVLIGGATLAIVGSALIVLSFTVL